MRLFNRVFSCENNGITAICRFSLTKSLFDSWGFTFLAIGQQVYVFKSIKIIMLFYDVMCYFCIFAPANPRHWECLERAGLRTY